MRNVHYYRFSGYTPTGTEQQEFVDNFDAEMQTYIKSRMSSLMSVSGYDMRRVDIAGQPTVDYIPTSGAWNGTGTSGILPFQVAPLVCFKAYATYPRSSRCYLAGMSTGVNTLEGHINGTSRQAFEDWGNAILSIPITGQLGANKVTVNWTTAPRVVNLVNQLDIVVVDNVWRTQRRRVRGVGI